MNNSFGKSRFFARGPQSQESLARNDNRARACVGVFGGEEVAEDEAVAVDDFPGLNRNRPAKDGAVEDESVELAVFAAGVRGRRKIAAEEIIKFAAGGAGVEDFGINANGNGAKALRAERLDEFARVAFPDRKESSHADASEILFAVGAQVF